MAIHRLSHQHTLTYLLKMASSSCMFLSVRFFTQDLWVAMRLHRPHMHATHENRYINNMQGTASPPAVHVAPYLVIMDAMCSLHPG